MAKLPLGLVPAAGRGERLRPLRLPKELLPVGVTDGPGGLRLKMACEYALDQLRTAGVGQAVVVIGDDKLEIVRTLGDGYDFGVELGYVVQRERTGLAAAVACAHRWLADRLGILVLPDTVIEPADAAHRALAELGHSGADVVLAVFPTDRPEELCAVEADAGGRVTALHDKVSGITVGNAWGLVVWQPRFVDFLRTALPSVAAGRADEVTLAEILELGQRAGLDVRALPIADGTFRDLGTPSGYLQVATSLQHWPAPLDQPTLAGGVPLPVV